MLQTAQASLVAIGLNTENPQIFWEGVEITDFSSIQVDWEDGEKRVKFKFGATVSAEIQAAMIADGITVKKGI